MAREALPTAATNAPLPSSPRPERYDGPLARFEREVQLTARLTHPNTITIFDYGRTDEGVFYYAMELLDGSTLQRIVEVDGPLAEGRVVHILKLACGALAAGIPRRVDFA